MYCAGVLFFDYYCYASLLLLLGAFFFFKQKTAYEMRISDWSSDVCSSDLIDCLLAYKPPRCFREGNPKVARLFPDWEAREKDYFARTGIFPIMHPIGVRKSLLAEHPRLAANLFAAFAEAKAMAIADLDAVQALKIAQDGRASGRERACRYV